jgi:hypothetical protein
MTYFVISHLPPIFFSEANFSLWTSSVSAYLPLWDWFRRVKCKFTLDIHMRDEREHIFTSMRGCTPGIWREAGPLDASWSEVQHPSAVILWAHASIPTGPLQFWNVAAFSGAVHSRGRVQFSTHCTPFKWRVWRSNVTPQEKGADPEPHFKMEGDRKWVEGSGGV